MSKLWWAIAAQLIGSIIAFFQLQGWVVWNKPWLQSIWWMYATSLIIAPLFFWSTKLSYEHFGYYWAIRPIGFGLATLTFGILTWLLLGEVPTWKIVISLK